MISASLPPNEDERLAALARFAVLDSSAEAAFDEIVSLVASVCEVPIALVSLVDAGRQWFKSKIGLAASETPRESAFCAHAILAPGDVMIVSDATRDPRFWDNPLVTGDPNIRSYAGTPLVTADGFALGTLCVVDSKPRVLTPQQENTLRIGGRAIMTLLEQRRTIAELQAAAAAQQRIEEELRAEIAQRLQVERQLSFSSSHDELTRLPNRTEFIAQLKAALMRLHSAQGRRFAVCFIDLDRFKVVNDTLGHSAGDLLLVEVGRRLNQVIRAGDAIGRLGGDEFTMLIDDVADDVTANGVAGRIADVLATKLQLRGTKVSIAASVGVCLVDETYVSVEDILRDADIAMYASKDRGRNRATIFTPALLDQFTFANEMQVTLRRALEQKRFRLAYQPVVSLQFPDEPPSAFEALLRLEQGDGVWQSAAQFIETAEQTDLIVELGGWVLGEACTQARRWERDCATPVVTAVNVSAKQLAEPDFAATVKAVLSTTGLDACLLALEVTESLLIVDVEASLAVITELRAFGVRIYLDDFGTGYSSLNYLRKFPVDRLKIDRSFVSGGAGDDLTDPVIINSIVSLAHKLNIEVVAEGVETETQRAALVALGCDWAQGFLFSRGLPAEEASQMLRSWTLDGQRTDAA